ncbi:MAG: squalene/phytoene synthase family protein, partial [Opitutales bacterium]|nr:squalene/phytoene synthase family protein [Opitutales bacterium]
MPQNIDKLDDSFESAYQSLQRKKSNLAFAFFCLDKQRAQDMGILYAYCRILDDISDDENAPVEEKKAALLKWKSELDLIYAN